MSSRVSMCSSDDLYGGDTASPSPSNGGQEEKIMVLVRMRPLNEKERARNDVSDWECINESTIIFKNSLPERSMFPSAYTYDRVFGIDCQTRQVYEEGAKEVSLSVVDGINASIFAYGQTSSGKTYTMRGITDYAVSDIYDYVEAHTEREFVLKFSAMEIYNESVRDLLSADSTPLRLLDDPERGTVVEKLTEETLEDRDHLKELLSICEAQRQIGETSLNETSSRSHQILRLTIESSARDYSGAHSSTTLAATVNFVDLAGSERASQTSSGGTRLKEGCHINRSLLTLGTVIRKLSKGRNGHVPFRDSKLTRILQNSLGGNGRTAIICTISPARSHVEQSRNTLLFATTAKEVSTNAQVNVVMSDKALVKQLQKELARLEIEMKNIESSSTKRDSATMLKEKETIIEQMNKEIQELTEQRDLAQSRIEKLVQSIEEGQRQVSKLDEYSAQKSSVVPKPLHFNVLRARNIARNIESPKYFNQISENAEDNFLLDDSTPKFVGLDPCQGWEEITEKIGEESEDTCKDVRCIEVEKPSLNRELEDDLLLPGPEEKEGKLSMTGAKDEDTVSSPHQEDKESSPINKDQNYDALKQKVKELQTTIDYLVNIYPVEQSPFSSEADMNTSRGAKMNRSTSCTAIVTSIPSSHWYDKAEQNENTPPITYSDHNFFGRQGNLYRKLSELKNSGKISRKSSQASMSSILSLESLGIKDSDVDDLTSIYKQNGNTPSPLWFEKQNENAPPARSERVYHESMESQGTKESDAEDASGIHEQDKNTTSSPLFEKVEQNEIAPPATSDSESKYSAEVGNSSTKDSQTSITSASVEPQTIKGSEAEDTTSIHYFVPQSNEMAKLPPEKQHGDDLVQKTETENEGSTNNEKNTGLDTVQDAIQQPPSPSSSWPAEFDRKRRDIIELWDTCNVPLVHRTYFFLLFKGDDPSDSVYMEVEFRRLSFLKGATGTNVTKDGLIETPASSLKALHREREMLSKQIHQKFSKKERESLYQKWGIALKTKQRSIQLGRRVWTDPKSMNHIQESAMLVAKLVGLVKPNQAPKEMFGLSFTSRSVNHRSTSWKYGMSF